LMNYYRNKGLPAGRHGVTGASFHLNTRNKT